MATSAAPLHRHVGRRQLVVRAVRRPRNLHHLERSGFETFLVFSICATAVKYVSISEIMLCRKCICMVTLHDPMVQFVKLSA